MRVSPQLFRQNLGWNFKKLWATKSVLKVQNSGVEKLLTDKGIPVVQPSDILREKPKFTKVEVVGYKSKPIAFDSTHPNWHERPLLTYKDNNVLLEGLKQAKVLTNTVEIQEGLPQLHLESNGDIDARVKEVILTAHVFDAEQKKLPKLKDPEKPAWNFPRIYGITQERRTKLLLLNLLQTLENYNTTEVVQQRRLVDNSFFSYNFEKFNNLIQFELTGDTLLTSANPLAPISRENVENQTLPDISPIKPTITLNEENIYEIKNIYPINLKFPKSHPHTVFVHHNEQEVGNIFEEEVTETQIYGRCLLKTFTVAASYAKEKFGGNVKLLPNPVTVQCVHTNGQLFNFGIFQLNTLDFEGSMRNIWYQSGLIPLFDSCGYQVGKPVLAGYNPKVVQYLNAFYNSI